MILDEDHTCRELLQPVEGSLQTLAKTGNPMPGPGVPGWQCIEKHIRGLCTLAFANKQLMLYNMWDHVAKVTGCQMSGSDLKTAVLGKATEERSHSLSDDRQLQAQRPVGLQTPAEHPHLDSIRSTKRSRTDSRSEAVLAAVVGATYLSYNPDTSTDSLPLQTQQTFSSTRSSTAQTDSWKSLGSAHSLLRMTKPQTSQLLFHLESDLRQKLGQRDPATNKLGSDCWVDRSFIHWDIGQHCCELSDEDCRDMIVCLKMLVSQWCKSSDGKHLKDEKGDRLEPRQATACLVLRLRRLVDKHWQLSKHSDVQIAAAKLMQSLRECSPGFLPAGMYDCDFGPVADQVCDVQQNWQSPLGQQKHDRAVMMLNKMTQATKAAVGGELSHHAAQQFVQALLQDFHPTTELEKGDLEEHLRYHMSFGRPSVDPQQWDMVTADPSRPLHCSAVPGSGKTTCSIARGVYTVGTAKESELGQGERIGITAVTFSNLGKNSTAKTAQQWWLYLENNFTIDGLWKRMDNDYHAKLKLPAVEVLGVEDLQQYVEGAIGENFRWQNSSEEDKWHQLCKDITERLDAHLQQAFMQWVGRDGVYQLKDVWRRPQVREDICAGLFKDPKVRAAMQQANLVAPNHCPDWLRKAIQAVDVLLWSRQEGQVLVWELLGRATYLWHMVTDQLPDNVPEENLQAAQDVLRWWRSRYAWLLDEFQDASLKQYAVLHYLICPPGRPHRVSVVGDPNQSIFAWRGSAPELFKETIVEDFPNAQVVRLTKNYRSTQNINERSRSLISKNLGADVDDTNVAEMNDNEPVEFLCFNNQQAEAQYIKREVTRLHQSGVWYDRRGQQKGPGMPLASIKIMARCGFQLDNLKRQLDKTMLGEDMLRGKVEIVGELSQDSYRQGCEVNDKLELTTIHKMKGDECVVGFIIGMTRDWRSRSDRLSQSSPNLLEVEKESRNIAYVAMTRAERKLYMSFVGIAGRANKFFHEAMLSSDRINKVTSLGKMEVYTADVGK